MKRVTNEEEKTPTSNHPVKVMLNKEHRKRVVIWTKAKVARDFKKQSLRNALLITVSGDRQKAAIWLLDKCEMGGPTICLQAILARMSCNEVLELVREEVLREYKDPAHNRGLQGGNRSVHQVGAWSDQEGVMDPTGAKGGKGSDDDDNEDEPAETAVLAFVATSLHKGSNWGSRKPLQQGPKKRKKKEPRRVDDPPLSSGEFIRAHPHGCFVCYGRSSPFQHEHRTFPIHKADSEGYKKAHGTKKRTSADIREAKVEVS